MPGSIPTDDAFRALEIALRGLSLRQQAIAHNLANVDTPGFRAREVAFEAELKRALGRSGGEEMTLARTHPVHLPLQDDPTGVTPQVVLQNTQSLRNDGNNVDIDREMLRLAETNLSYNALAQLVAKKFAMLRSIINEGKR